MKSDNLLMVADSERDADMLYAVGMFVPDPFIYFRVKGRGYVVVSELELGRARREARGCRVLSLAKEHERLRRPGLARPVRMADVIVQVLRDRRVKKVQVPEHFPVGLARQLRHLKLKIKPREGAVFPERARKRAEEVKKISAALAMAEVGLSEAIHVLKNSRIGRQGRLMYHQVPLTSEKLRATIDVAILQAGGVASRTIVAGGRQGADPHEAGHGVLRAHEPIILDVFPRSRRTGYFGDITRTVVRGRASEAVRGMYAGVSRAQEVALREIEPGARGADIHEAVRQSLERDGFRTRRRAGRPEGFFHGTGHGVGLEIHEAPSLGAHSEDRLQEGNVVTVEPGLYYPGVGGVRLEDMVLVGGRGYRNLTRFEKILEL